MSRTRQQHRPGMPTSVHRCFLTVMGLLTALAMLLVLGLAESSHWPRLFGFVAAVLVGCVAPGLIVLVQGPGSWARARGELLQVGAAISAALTLLDLYQRLGGM